MTEYTDQQRLDQYQKDLENRGTELQMAYINFENDERIAYLTKEYYKAKDKVKELRTKLGIEEKLE